MNRLFISILCCFSLVGTAYSQVFADFEDEAQGTQGFFDNGWGTGFTSVAWSADATGRSAGVLALACDASAGDKGDIQIDNLEAAGAAVISFWIYLPTDFPSDGYIKLWGQDNVNWGWNDVFFSGADIPKETWIPLNFDILAQHLAAPSSFDPYAPNKFGKFGLEVGLGSSTTWTGTVLVDDGTYLGVEPDVYANFEDEALGTQGFFDNGWGTGFTSVAWSADATGRSVGVLALACDASAGDKGDIQMDNLEAGDAAVMSIFVYVPADFPSDGYIKLWGQDNVNWGWNDVFFSGADLTKETWIPLNFDILTQHSAAPGSFDPYPPNKFGKFGLEVGFGSSTTWTGTILVDEAARLTTKVGKEWVLADFENEGAGTQGFENTGWNAALTNIGWSSDPTSQSAGVLLTDWDAALDVKGSFQNQNISLQWTDTDTGATEIAFDIYLPSDFPSDAIIKFWATDKVTWTWNQYLYSIGDGTVEAGKWNVITFNVLEKVTEGTLDPEGTIRAGIEVEFTSGTTWANSLYLDNFTLVGVEPPESPLQSPTVSVSVDTLTQNLITWIDNETNHNETYNVYASQSPITDPSASGVVRIGYLIGRGIQQWIHRPYTSDGSEQSYYYAVTATGPDGVETDIIDGVSNGGPVTNTTAVTAKAVFDPNFSSSFVIDGDLEEFYQYSTYAITPEPEKTSGDSAAGWDPNSLDLNYSATIVIDHDYLYIGAYVMDDDPYGGDGTGQAWEGDAIEFYTGFYDANNLAELYSLNTVDQGTGNWRISFMSDGRTQIYGFQDYDFPGVDYAVDRNPVGYMVEAKINLDSLSADGYSPAGGDFLPLRIDNTDRDPAVGDASRTLLLQWGGAGNDQSWLRPSCWGYLEVFDIYGVAVSGEPDSGIPTSISLHKNYPNPFNPTTTIQFDLPEATEVTLTVHNILGQKVKTIITGIWNAGSYKVKWDGLDESGALMGSGVYFYTLETADYVKTHKMVLLR